LPAALRGTVFLLCLVTAASMMPVEKLPPASWQTSFGLGFLSAVFDNIPLTKLALEQAVRLGHARLRCRLRRFDDLVRSSAGVAITSLFPEARSVWAWLRAAGT